VPEKKDICSSKIVNLENSVDNKATSTSPMKVDNCQSEMKKSQSM
jgi:hypothetical protein